MRLYRLEALDEADHGHVFHALVEEEFISEGELLFVPRGVTAHEDEATHVHDREEIFVILQGKAVVHFDDSDEAIGPGDVMVIEPGENHHLESDEADPCVLLYLHGGPARHPDQQVV